MAKKEKQPETAPKKKAAAKPKAEGIDKAIQREEKPYSLPKGCRESEVISDIRNYGIFEFEERIYSLYDANGWKGKYAKAVSNFTCRIDAHIELPDGTALKLITIRNVDKEEFTFHCGGDQVLALPTFRKITAGDKGNFDFNATDNVYRHVLRRMQDNMGRGRLVRELGMQPEGFFVMCNAVLMPSGEVVEINEQGCFDFKGSRYYVPASKESGGSARGTFTNARKVHYVQSETTWKQLTSKLRDVHREHSFTAITFAVATVFRDIIKKKLGGFPLLFFYGEPGSGKDQVIDTCRTLFGEPQSPLLLSGKNTGPALNMFAELVCVPQCCAEWKNSLPMEVQEMCFGLWQGDGRRRGRMTVETSPYATDAVPIECTAYFTGNEYPNVEEKGMTRFLIEEMDKDTFNEDEMVKYHELGELKTEGYSYLLADVVGQRPRFKAEWFSDYFKPAQSILMQAAKGQTVHGRMMQNMATLLSVYMFFEGTIEWAFTRDEFTAHLVDITLRQQRKRKEGDVVADFWTCFIAAKRKSMIHEDVHYRIEGDRLTFFWSEIHAVYEEVYKTLGRRKPPLAETTMLGKLKKHRCFEETKAIHSIGGRKNRAQCFLMSESGTELRGLLTVDAPPDRHLGDHNGEPVMVKWGAKGSYLKHLKNYANLPKGLEHANVTLTEALHVLGTAQVTKEPVAEEVDDFPM